MSGELSFGEECFWEHILLLQKKMSTMLGELSAGRTSALNDPMDLTRLYADSDTRNYLLRILGVQGGSFGLAHRSSNQFKLVQWSFTGLPDELPQLRLPYLDPDSGDNDIGISFVDLAFTSLRTRQPLREALEIPESLENGKKQYSILPEFYLQLPPHGDKHLCVSDAEKERRGRGVDLLLCPAGEVAFFIWAWLWIRKLVSRGADKQLVIEEQEIDRVRLPEAENTWDVRFWREEKGFDLADPPTDIMFADFIDELCTADESADTLKVPEANLAAARKQWERIKAIEVSSEDDLVLACGRQRDGKFDEAMSALIECALNLGKKQQARLKHPESLNWMDDVRRAISNLEVLKTRVFKEKVDLSGLEQNLKCITVFALLKMDKNCEHLDVSRIYNCGSLQAVVETLNLTGYKALTGIHKLARFPIIHYYCLQLLYKKPLEHLVFPVWKSFKYAETIKSGDTNTLITPDVVLALLSITPPGFVEEDECKVTTSSSAVPPLAVRPESNRQISRDSQLSRIQCLMKVLASPLIDYGFYGSLVSAEQEAMGKVNAFHSIPAAFASSIDALEEHAENCRQGFKVPPGLYLAAFEAMVSAGRRPVDIQKWSLRLPEAVRMLQEQGVSGRLFEYLLKPEGTVCLVSRARLLRDNLRDLKKPTFHISGEGRIPVKEQKSGFHEFLIPVLVILLKEAYEHSVRAVIGVDREPVVSVSLDAQKNTITIANTSKEFNIKRVESGMQNHFLREFMGKIEGWKLEDLLWQTPDQAIRVLRRIDAS